MDTVVLVELGALALALYAGWRSLPRPVERDGERLLKVSLATVLRGPVEAEGGTIAQWSAAVLPAVLYHPAGREPEAKLLRPDPAALPTPALPGERGLVEELARIESPVARLQAMYVGAEAAAEALLTDPALHGEAWDLSRHLAPDLSWDDVAAWSEGLLAVLGRRLGHLVAVEAIAAGSGDGADGAGSGIPLAEALPGEGGGIVPVPASVSEQAWTGEAEDWEPGEAEEALSALLLGHCERPEQRLVLVARGNAAGPLLRAICGVLALKDRVAAVLLVDPQWSPAERDWLERWFTHPAFEPEVVRRVPYAALLDCDPSEPAGWARWPEQRLPRPEEPASGRLVLDVVDLGPLALRAVPPEALARALVVWLALGLGT